MLQIGSARLVSGVMRSQLNLLFDCCSQLLFCMINSVPSRCADCWLISPLRYQQDFENPRTPVRQKSCGCRLRIQNSLNVVFIFVHVDCSYKIYLRVIMLINLLKSTIFCNSGSGKVIRNRYPGPDHQQKLNSSSDW